MLTSEQTLREALAAQDPQAALAAAEQATRADPGAAKPRIALFQVMCVLGLWKRAMAQLEVIGQLDAQALAMVSTYREAIKCEVVRAQVFAGTTTPLAFGEPQPWLAWLVEALQREAAGQAGAASELRAKAFEEAVFPAGTANQLAFEWIADADPRLGPVLEAIVNGRYYWMPFAALARIDVDPPEDLRDMVWTAVHLSFVNGGEAVGLVPTRYPGSEQSADGAVRLARKTLWETGAGGSLIGMGQRVLATEDREVALLELRQIEFQQPAAGP
jgi:type VI secretion system protein ImpE